MSLSSRSCVLFPGVFPRACSKTLRSTGTQPPCRRLRCFRSNRILRCRAHLARTARENPIRPIGTPHPAGHSGAGSSRCSRRSRSTGSLRPCRPLRFRSTRILLGRSQLAWRSTGHRRRRVHSEAGTMPSSCTWRLGSSRLRSEPDQHRSRAVLRRLQTHCSTMARLCCQRNRRRQEQRPNFAEHRLLAAPAQRGSPRQWCARRTPHRARRQGHRTQQRDEASYAGRYTPRAVRMNVR